MNFDDAMREFRAYLVDDTSTATETETAWALMEPSPLPRPRILRRATALAVGGFALAAVVVGVIAIRSTRPAPDAAATARVDWGLDAVVQVTPDRGISVRDATARAMSDIDLRARNADISGFRRTADDGGIVQMRFPGGEDRFQVEQFLHIGRVAVADPWGPVNRPGSGYSLQLASVAEYGVQPPQTGEPFTATDQTMRMLSGPPDQRHTLAPIVRALHAETVVGPMDLIVEQRPLGAVAVVNGDGVLVYGTMQCATGLGAPLISRCGSSGGGPFTAPDGTVHAAVFTTFAPLSPKIARIELRSTDGRTFPGTVGNGWYLIMASTRGPMRVLHRGTLVGYDAAGKQIATAQMFLDP